MIATAIVTTKRQDSNDFVEENAWNSQTSARSLRLLYRTLDEQSRKLYRTICFIDAFMSWWHKLLESCQVELGLIVPIQPWRTSLVQLAQAVHKSGMEPTPGDGVYYMSYRMLDKDGANILCTHEMTHDSDQDIYLGGYGRRSGLGPECSLQKVYCVSPWPNQVTQPLPSILSLRH